MNETQLRDKKCEKIARKILSKIASFDDGVLFEEDVVKRAKAYKDLQVDILTYYKKESLTPSEINYVRKLIISLVDTPLLYVTESIAGSYANMMKKLFGKDESEINMSDMDKILNNESTKILEDII